MAKELRWLVGLGLAGSALFQLATNTRIEVRISAAAQPVPAMRG